MTLRPRTATRRRAALGALAALAILGGLAAGIVAAMAGPSPAATGGPSQVAVGSERPGASPSVLAPSPSTLVTSTPPSSPTPSATAAPGSTLVRAPLTGRLVAPDVALRHPIAVMIDDLSPARPQSGFSAASIVYQAPAEGGIPRYMMVFQENIPTDVGPVRSSRYYYIAWAAELRAIYAHAGGSPQALATLRKQGQGQLVFNADEFRWARSFHRISTRFSPHNLYTTGKALRALVRATGAKDAKITWPWTFAPDQPIEKRPVGGRIQVTYLANAIRYDYDRLSNSYLRSNTTEKKQIDASTKRRVAPKNVIVMLMHFGPLNDGHPQKHRLEGQVIGSGPAWISTNGVTIKGTWKKTALTSATRFLDARGRPVALTVGQTFVQVMPYGSKMSFVPGKRVPPPPEPIGHVPF
ncbi:MAG TPA: DUF3048 domain-containing protein [Candidatus Limnocylindrales bacterium]|nr:DUF3048 domain-containing protein [Candidatus Limnocylindrales bacterium]